MTMEPGPTYQPQQTGTLPPLSAATPGTTNGYAIASLVLGIVGLTGFPLIPSVLALIFGYKGRRQIDRAGGAEQGRGLAVAGIVLGWIGTIFLILVGLLIAGAVLLNVSAVGGGQWHIDRIGP